ncbi:TetR/AcrR family transcriptional regulator [Pantoea sp. Tr-811]|uniref:TetR/AcrR family transcriptional regulator n=1 Tax=Pantoea sp. Tr-811 TaxID=2608361 RepID=UPI00141E4629|nr:TetR/AcrR family transcriptional regulator [Pantoea sp. Tr-811]NIF28940.1 TetR/AcrR family transcriptional regulator [Pantoea sp. Tr-811]
MSGLRERQKEERRKGILKAALELFQAEGFEATTIDQIGALAGVSPPTVSNYFAGGKQDILFALLRAPDEKVVAGHRGKILDEADPVEAFCAFERLIADSQLKAMPSNLWREIAPLLMTGQLTQILQPWNETVVAEAGVMLAHFQAQGMFRLDLDVPFVSRLFNDYLNLAFLRLATTEQPDLVAHSAHVRKVVILLLSGLRNPIQ